MIEINKDVIGCLPPEYVVVLTHCSYDSTIIFGISTIEKEAYIESVLYLSKYIVSYSVLE